MPIIRAFRAHYLHNLHTQNLLSSFWFTTPERLWNRRSTQTFVRQHRSQHQLTAWQDSCCCCYACTTLHSMWRQALHMSMHTT